MIINITRTSDKVLQKTNVSKHIKMNRNVVSSKSESLRFRGFLEDAVAVRALHHQTPGQALPAGSWVVEVGK